MKKMTTTLMISAIILSSSFSALAETERAKPNKFAPQQEAAPAQPMIRLFANYDYVMTSPSALNDTRSRTLWGTTTPSQGTFAGMNGFSVGASYLVGPGYLGAEYAFAAQELPTTTIIPTTTTISDSFDYQTVYAVYDLAYDINESSSYEFGGGIGYALTYQYHNTFSSNGTTEEVIYQANPIVFKVRGFYNYHFSENVRARAGASYEYATSDSLTADSNHPTIGSGIISGQTLKDVNNSNQVVNMSGFRLSAGIVIAF